MSKLKEMKEALKTLKEAKVSKGKAAELDKIQAEAAELRRQIAQQELTEAREADIAVVERAQAVSYEACDNFDATVAEIEKAWRPIAELVRESEEIRDFLTRARDMGRSVKDAPAALSTVFIPDSLTPEFTGKRHGFSGLSWLIKRLNEGKYLNFRGPNAANDLSSWLYCQGLRLDQS